MREGNEDEYQWRKTIRPAAHILRRFDEAYSKRHHKNSGKKKSGA